VAAGFPPARSAGEDGVRIEASAGEARSEKIMLNNELKRNADLTKNHFALAVRCICKPRSFAKKARLAAGFFFLRGKIAYMLHPEAGHST
jgi:hypothetical protein